MMILIMELFKEDGMMKTIFRLAASVAAVSMVAFSCAKIEEPSSQSTETKIEESEEGDSVVKFECSITEDEASKTPFNEE